MSKAQLIPGIEHLCKFLREAKGDEYIYATHVACLCKENGRCTTRILGHVTVYEYPWLAAEAFRIFVNGGLPVTITGDIFDASQPIDGKERQRLEFGMSLECVYDPESNIVREEEDGPFYVYLSTCDWGEPFDTLDEALEYFRAHLQADNPFAL